MKIIPRIPPFLLAAAALLLLATAGVSELNAHGSLASRITLLNRRLAAEPLDARLYLERGELHRLHEDYEAARADYDRAAGLDPALERVDLCRGALDFEAGRGVEALDRLDSYLARVPEDGEALKLRARVHSSLGHPAAAVADFDRALGLLPRVTPDDRRERESLAGRAGIDESGSRFEPSPLLQSMVRSLPSPAAAATVLPRTSTWKYLATATDPGTGWRAASFNDGAWPSGPAPLGYGDPFIVTTVPYGGNAADKWRTTYFRVHFNLGESPATVQSLTLLANYDDGFVAYLNGTEIVRRSLPGSAIVYSTFATSHEGGSYETIDVSAGIGFLLAGDNVLAVEVHQTTAGSSDIAMAMELVTSTGAPVLTRGPYLQIGTPGGVTVRWRSGAATNSRVRYGSSPAALANVVDDAALVTEHEMALTGLAPDTRYYYSVGSSTDVLAGGDSTFTFVTAPVPGTPKPTRVWVLGDSGDPTQFANQVRDGYEAFTGSRETDLWLMLGDNAYNSGTDSEYQTGVFNVYPEMLRRSVLWPTRGNHDAVYAGANNDYYDIFSLPMAGQAGGVSSLSEAYYSFDYGNTHFICLDSEGSDRSVSGSMLDWLVDDLAATTADWTIAFWHHPPYTKGSHDSDDAIDSGGRMRDMRTNALPILESAGVDLVLTGHSHSYERSYLLDEHYGLSGTFHDSMKVDGGDGDLFGDGAYLKPGPGLHPHAGAVYAVAGSSCKLGGGPLNHPAMFTSMNVLGSVVLDIDGLQLEVAFIDETGTVRDSYSIVKSGASAAPGTGAGVLSAPPRNHPNPFRHQTKISYRLEHSGPVTITISDVSGRRVATLLKRLQDPGDHEIVWDGTDDGGAPVSPGVYFSVVQAGGERRSRKLVLSR